MRQILSTAYRQARVPTLMKLIAPGMPSEIVVVIQQKNFGVCPESLSVIVRSCQPRYAGADNN